MNNLRYSREDPRAHPRNAHTPYTSTHRRAPKQAPVSVEHTLSEVTGPRPRQEHVGAGATDLTRWNGGESLGERIIVTGRVLDEQARPVRGTLVEIWQANAAGRYAHDSDQHDAPLDPHFLGAACMMTDEQGAYRFMTVKPGAYPWRNHHNAWRPQHIHFSLFGPAFATRLVTQMYFPGDPLLALDPIFNSVPDTNARDRLVAAFDLSVTIPELALAYRFDLVLRGRAATPMESETTLRQTPSQTVGPFFSLALIRDGLNDLAARGPRGQAVNVEGRVLDGDGVPVPDAMIETWQANTEGRYDHRDDTQEKLLDSNFHGFGRAGTNADGWYRVHTIRPGSVPDPYGNPQAPHINVSVFARGLLKRVVTRIYFPGEPLNERDAVLNSVPTARRAMLVAKPADADSGTNLRFDIVLQGTNETVFFDV